MRWGLRTKEVVGIVALTFVVVTSATCVHLAQLTRVVIENAAQQAELIAKQIYAQTGQSLARARRRPSGGELQPEPELQSLLEASVGYSPYLVYALIADGAGRVILHSERDKEGSVAPERSDLRTLVSAGPVRRLRILYGYGGGGVWEAVLPLALNGAPFGSIRLGVSSSLLRSELTAALKGSLALAGLALAVASLVAIGLANVLLRPVRILVREMSRLRQGEFNVGAALEAGDELGDLAGGLQLLGQQLQSERLQMLSERAHLQQVVDGLEDAIIFLNDERRILFFNKASEAIVGRPLEQAVGARLDEVLEPAHPCRALVERIFAEPAGVRKATVVVPTERGPRALLASGFLVTDGGLARGAVALFKDLESVKTLQSLISYSAKLTELGRLTSGVAHEVKNPLNAMMIHLELLRERLGGAPGEVQENLEIIASEIRRLDRVVQGFLRFLRPQELNLKPVDLNAVLRDMVALLEAEWGPAGVRFAIEAEPALPAIAGDQELLHQALMNIVLNACQAMPVGGAVRIATERAVPGSVIVRVADEGVGIAPADLDRIFKLYYTTKPEGSGIGLAVAYRIVQLHDGAIGVSSEVGRGTTVSVQLPVR
ncbi:MAG TPA: ATP-binding protein [Candidatus Polarisedimenticolia bacterium]|nr:ATP-binding protein [Candidatus Polarisedimenticolia bacterium]